MADVTVTPACHLCGEGRLEALPGFEAFRRVTSDAKSCPPGGRLAVCGSCGGVQKIVDEAWTREVDRIYAGYTVYYQAGGAEQAVFGMGDDRARGRSAAIVERLGGSVELPEKGRLVDIGCGNGAFLAAFLGARKGWRGVGVELDDRNRARIESIAGVESLHVGPVAEAPGEYELASLIHVVEHLPRPGAFLAAVRGKLRQGGILLVETPAFEDNPFDLLIADHASHFTRSTIDGLLRRSGFDPAVLASDWVPKEFTALARKAARSTAPAGTGGVAAARRAVEDRLAWLRDLVRRGRAILERGPAGIFGTSIAGTWLASELGDGVRFFVDEDPNRQGRTHLGLPIHAPPDAPKGSDVVLALPPAIARVVANRLARGPATYHQPGPLEAAGSP